MHAVAEYAKKGFVRHAAAFFGCAFLLVILVLSVAPDAPGRDVAASVAIGAGNTMNNLGSILTRFERESVWRISQGWLQ